MTPADALHVANLRRGDTEQFSWGPYKKRSPLAAPSAANIQQQTIPHIGGGLPQPGEALTPPGLSPLGQPLDRKSVV